jgi:uncharacterized protein YbjT (DUF2867 family)
MVRLLLLGASGVVGRAVLPLALEHQGVATVIAPTRNVLPSHDKLTNPVSARLESLVPQAIKWCSIDAVICALGTTMKKAGSQKSFYRVDHDLPVAFARAARQRGAEAFALVSAIGASSSSRFFYPRTKGQTETDVQSVGFKSLTILRPMIVEGERGEFRLGESIVLRMVQFFGPILPRRLRANPASTIAYGARLMDGVHAGSVPARPSMPQLQRLHRTLSKPCVHLTGIRFSNFRGESWYSS